MAAGRALAITLFTRQQCSLCVSAKLVLDNVQQKRPFIFRQVDVMAPQNEQWKIYEFDVPVVCEVPLASCPD